jgi:hypothetical protein
MVILVKVMKQCQISVRGGDTVTPYSNAGIFSILTFSWIGPLIAVGNKKTLDVEDVPQLDPVIVWLGAFRPLEISLRQSVVQLTE